MNGQFAIIIKFELESHRLYYNSIIKYKKSKQALRNSAKI